MALAEAHRLDRPFRIAHPFDRYQHCARQKRQPHRGGEVGHGAVARADDDTRVGPPWVVIGDPTRYGGQVDVAEPVRVHPLGSTDPGVDLLQHRPRQPAAHPHRPTGPAGIAQMGESLAAERGADRGQQCGRGVEQGDRIGRLEGGHRISSSNSRRKPSGSLIGQECDPPGATSSRPW